MTSFNENTFCFDNLFTLPNDVLAQCNLIRAMLKFDQFGMSHLQQSCFLYVKRFQVQDKLQIRMKTAKEKDGFFTYLIKYFNKLEALL